MQSRQRAAVRAAVIATTLCTLGVLQPGQLPQSASAATVPATAGRAATTSRSASVTRSAPAARAAAVPVTRPTGPVEHPIVAAAIPVLDAIESGDRAAERAALTSLAEVVAPAAELDPVALAAVWHVAEQPRLVVLASALSQVGVGYRYASARPGTAFDCSGLASWAWAQAGVELPHQSKRMINATAKKDIAGVLPGDILWYPGHVSVALGVGGAYVHAPYRGRTVEVDTLSAKRLRRIVVGSPI